MRQGKQAVLIARGSQDPLTLCLLVPVSGERVPIPHRVSEESLPSCRLNSAGLFRADPLRQNRALLRVPSVPSDVGFTALPTPGSLCYQGAGGLFKASGTPACKGRVSIPHSEHQAGAGGS